MTKPSLIRLNQRKEISGSDLVENIYKKQLETLEEIKKFRIHTDEELFKKAKCEPSKLISKKNHASQKVVVSQKSYKNPLII